MESQDVGWILSSLWTLIGMFNPRFPVVVAINASNVLLWTQPHYILHFCSCSGWLCPQSHLLALVSVDQVGDRE